jgi:D-alanyl-D-alanine carboxypeptidase
MTENELVSDFSGKLAQESAEGRFSGAVLIARQGQPIFTQAYGLADRERGIANTLQTRFRVGSINKMFTGLAVVQLVEAGKVQLADSLGTYVADYPDKATASKVTIEQLLSHTAGTGDLFGPEYEAHRLEVRTLQDFFVMLYADRNLRFEPGSRWEYSNYGYILLGVVIERVSGQSYYDYVHDHIYKPAQMWSSGSEAEDEFVPERGVGYTLASGTMVHSSAAPLPYLRPNTSSLPFRGSSAGGGYSTVHDLLNFATALLADRLLSARYTELLMAGRVETDHGTHYGYGFETRTIKGLRSVGHSGGGIGMNGMFEIFPDIGYVVVVLANLDPPAAGRISTLIAERLGDVEHKT